ncbi:UMP-CMP kinase [Daktulosphaira vitifoliae]|uniref:UMP-CMP kinase n=1 Tax=Daktulosphaira vitifoliae TaxID=58002 RepID=UPI0021AAD7A0|nr:UMP-CMP kinase [Daktulosphaira vitifoliae]
MKLLFRSIYRVFTMSKPQVVFVLGGPGAGKGTQCSNIVSKFGFVHLSAGDLLRAERNKPDSKYGELIDTHIKNGTIVPVEVTCKLIQNAMEASTANRFLIDGFPRNKDNMTGWTRTIGDQVELLFVLFLDCPEEICIERCMKRGAAGSGRADDNLESLKKRIVTFVNDSMPIIEHFKEKNLVKKVEAGKNAADVWVEICKLFKDL